MKKIFFLILLSLFVQIHAMEKVSTELIQSVSIAGTSVATVALYSIAQSQLSAMLCPSYFSNNMQEIEDGLADSSIIKNMLVSAKSKSLKAAIWGTYSSLRFGALSGASFALASRFGPQAQLDTKDLIKPIGIVVAAAAGGSLLYGWLGRWMAKQPTYRSHLRANDVYCSSSNKFCLIESDEQPQFVQVSWMKASSYYLAGASSLGVLGYILCKRCLD